VVSESDVRFFQENGYLPPRPLLSADEVAELRERCYAIIEGKAEGKPLLNRELYRDERGWIVIQVVNAWEADRKFYELLFHPQLAEAVAKLMGTDTVRVWHDQIQYKPPKRGGPTIWHQDYPYWPSLEPPDLLSAWIALDDADVENGCMHVVPRSHRWGAYKGGTIGSDPQTWGPAHDPSFVPEGETVEIVPCPVPAGWVMFHHCLTWHGTPPNLSERPRPAIAIHFMPGYTRYAPRGRHVCEEVIQVAPGEILRGEHFPTVWENGHPVEPALARV
jgi:phytanoyl-CoA hydroxylase